MDQQERWIWPFELLEKIGEGGMGVVYKARYVVNDRLLAVKLLPKDVSDPSALARFERELEILKEMRHPNIVRCFGGACENKRRFYAMELVEGGSLDALIHHRHRLPWEQVVEFGLQMCAALGYAHDKGVIHRDVKPGNFLMTTDGRLKLSDFGLATVSAARRITAAGKTMGTYHYMAPEQIRGGTMSGRADLYALGCVLQEMLTGQPPFDGAAAAEILQKHLRDTPPRVAASAPDCPVLLERLVSDLLAKSADDRPADAREVAKRLQAVTQTVTVETKRRPGEVRVGNTPVQARPTELEDTKTVAKPKTEAEVPQPQSAWVVPAVTLAIAVLLVWNLATLGRTTPGQSAESLWIQSLHDENEDVRITAAKALGELAATSPNAAKALISALENISEEPPRVRAAVVEAIGSAGTTAQSSVARLTKIQKTDSEIQVRTQAAAAIQKIKDAQSPGRHLGFYLSVLTILTAMAFIGWHVWRQRVRRA